VRVLFFDDEPMVLDGLRGALRPFRKKWEKRSGRPSSNVRKRRVPAL
jgi:hypothetical protein